MVVSNQPAVPQISNNNGVLTTSTSGGSIQWFLNGTAISGANEPQLTPTAVGNYTVTVTQGSCSSTSAPFTVTTIDVNAASPDAFLVFPNPAQEKLFIRTGFRDTQSQVMVVLNDLSGKQVLLQRISPANLMEIETSSLASGMYLLTVSNGKEQQVVRVGIAH